MTDKTEPVAAELLPCPFCGHRDIRLMVGVREHRGYSVLCGRCGVRQGSSGRTREQAIAAWNTRLAALSIPTEALVERARRVTADVWYPNDDPDSARARGCILSGEMDHTLQVQTATRALSAREPSQPDPRVDGLRRELTNLCARIENRRDKGDWQLSGDDSKALFHARAALAQWEAGK